MLKLDIYKGGGEKIKIIWAIDIHINHITLAKLLKVFSYPKDLSKIKIQKITM